MLIETLKAVVIHGLDFIPNLTNREALTVLCSVVKRVESGLSTKEA